MDLHEENIYKIKAENMYLTAENHALKEENHALKEVNNDIVQRLKAAEDSVSLLKSKNNCFKETKTFESTYNNESATETQIKQHKPKLESKIRQMLSMLQEKLHLQNKSRSNYQTNMHWFSHWSCMRNRRRSDNSPKSNELKEKMKDQQNGQQTPLD